MPIKINVEDGAGTGHLLKVNGEGNAEVVVHPHPPKDETELAIPFRQYFTDDGTTSGSNDMEVNGSSDPIDFYIKADTDKDIYIKTCNLLIEDAGLNLNEFGNFSALSTGCSLVWESDDVPSGEVTIADELKTNFDFMRLAQGDPPIGQQANAFIANNVSGSAEAIIPNIDFSKIFGLPWGIRLRKSSNDRLIWRINDNIPNIESFNSIAYGIKF